MGKQGGGQEGAQQEQSGGEPLVSVHIRVSLRMAEVDEDSAGMDATG